jgi:hypothetical protein
VIRRIGSRTAAPAVLAIGLAVTAWATRATLALAASPSPAGGAGDPRSPGEGPGLVGEPLVAIVIVVVIGLGAVAATLLWIRLTPRRDS